MDLRAYELHGVRIVELPQNGEQLRSDRQAIDIISDVSAFQPELIVIPVERLSAEFFDLKTRVAGEVLQKFVTYRKRVAILGDISAHVHASSSFRDFVYECNTGREIWFVTGLEQLDEKLAQAR